MSFSSLLASRSRAKLALSSQREARIREDDLDLDGPVARAELERLLEPALDGVDAALE